MNILRTLEDTQTTHPRCIIYFTSTYLKLLEAAEMLSMHI